MIAATTGRECQHGFGWSIRRAPAGTGRRTCRWTVPGEPCSWPANISTLGEFDSPRGCRGAFGSIGTAQATRIEADLTGTDCRAATFTGRVVLTKQ